MAHGTPDWGVTAGAVTTYQVTDLGELAARLGSPITYDRRGDIIWWDDFEWSLNKWTADVSGTGAAAALSAVQARNGRESCALTAGTNGLKMSSIYHYGAVPRLGRLGYEWSFGMTTAIDNLAARAVVRTGALQRWFEVRWRDADNDLQYRAANAAWVTFADGVDLSVVTFIFHTAKLVVDAKEGKYVRFILDGTEYSLAGIAGEDIVDLTSPYHQLALLNTGPGVTNPIVYIDDVIVTQNEPA